MNYLGKKTYFFFFIIGLKRNSNRINKFVSYKIIIPSISASCAWKTFTNLAVWKNTFVVFGELEKLNLEAEEPKHVCF